MATSRQGEIPEGLWKMVQDLVERQQTMDLDHPAFKPMNRIVANVMGANPRSLSSPEFVLRLSEDVAYIQGVEAGERWRATRDFVHDLALAVFVETVEVREEESDAFDAG